MQNIKPNYNNTIKKIKSSWIIKNQLISFRRYKEQLKLLTNNNKSSNLLSLLSLSYKPWETRLMQ